MALLSDHLKQVLRRLGRAPLFTAITLLTLAVGVGANTVIFSVVEGVLLKPLPYPHPEQLIGVWHTAPGIGLKELNMAPSIYFIDREQSTTLQDIGVYGGDSFNVTGTGQPDHVRGLDVTDGTLPILGVRPALGHLFTRKDDSPGSPETVLISYGYWQRKFGGSSSVIGRSITADGRPREIIGVLPQGFHFLDWQDADIVAPFQWDRGKIKLGNFSQRAIARLRPGVTMAQASADMARLLPVVLRSFPSPEGFSITIFEKARISPNLRPLKQDVVGDVGKVLWVLMGSIALVLLVACANVANLLLVRVEGRRQELAIRSALGAAWTRIAGELLFESIVLGVAGSLIGLAFAYGALRILVATAPTGLPRIHEIGIDLPVLLFTMGLALFTSLLIGSIPVIKYAGASVNSSLREGGRALSQSRERHRARKALVIVQVALALVLLICSGLMIRTFHALMHVSPGFDSPDSVQSFRFYIPDTQIPDKDRDRIVHMQQAILDKLAAIPGVSAAALSSAVPMDDSDTNDVLFAEDHMQSEAELPPIRRFKFVSPGSFATLGTKLVAGRDLTWTDEYQKLPVAIISENFARQYWHDPRSALGKRIRVATTDDWREIVGVAQNVHDNGVDQPAPSTVYWPIMQNNFEGQKEMVQRGIAFVLRSPRAGSRTFMDEVQQRVWSIDPDVPLADVTTLGELYTKSMARTSFTLVMLSVAGAMALLLGIVGIYGVISYSVSQRTREIGIRMALGAQRKTLTGMFVRQGLWLTCIGVACGLVVAFVTMRLMSSLLFNVSPVDPVTYASITGCVVATAYLACYLPARRAATVDPVDALRSE
ncbi:putative permease [Silvibacterium bohemicum]|uniref:Putative permease n=1 Tax=Silvibacterium bohemicum TaxID=1577686 RepID=A0A841JUJ8_9BACT|nr:ABC transporter permease [Silvibacterium bohemicum]MBB6143429.1 putative permease [Silvibacterium bohemicum]